MKLSPLQIRSLAAGLTVNKCRKSTHAFWHLNHEIWRTCADCREEFDLRKTLDVKCPKCGSTNITR